MIILMTPGDFVLSMTASLCASFIFIFIILFLLRPRIKIASEICKRKGFFDEGDPEIFIFKVINMSLFSAYDINIELNCMESYPVQDGQNFRFTPLKMKREKINFVAPYRPKWARSKRYGDFALLFITTECLHDILQNEHKSVQLQITLRHGVTGLSKVYNMDYAHHTLIKHGNFSFGNSFAIV